MLRASGCVLYGIAVVGASVLSADSLSAQSANPPVVLCLHTELLPYRHEVEKGVGYCVFRELSRQAMLVAAREELGYTTYDTTLGETVPKKGKVVHLVLADRPALNKTWEVRLFAYDPSDRRTDPRDLWATQEPLWKNTYKWSSGGSYSYEEVYDLFEEASRNEFVEALKLAGLEKQPAYTESPTEYELADMEQELLAVDFIRQYGAVRAAHQHIRTNGQSRDMLGILTRGYANLSLLTYHQWNSASEAFMARAMIYARRLSEMENESEFAMWNRAYMWGVIGCHYAAIADLKRLGDAEPPAWGTLIAPLVKYDYEGLKKIAADDESLAGMAVRLHFVLIAAARYPEWMEPHGIALAQKYPTSYDVMAELTSSCNSMRANRGGARAAPHYYGRNAHRSLNAVKGLPTELKALLPTDPVKAQVVMAMMEDPDPTDDFSAFPTFAAGRLRKDTRGEVSAGLSWVGLAYLMEEEVFVQVANFLHVSTNATEHSLAPQVNSVKPFIRNHRYANFIEAYKFRTLHDGPTWKELCRQLEPVDIDEYSFAVYDWNRAARKGTDNEVGEKLSYSRDFTMSGVTNSALGSDAMMPATEGLSFYATMYARELGKIAPNSEVPIRIAAQGTWKAKKKQVKEWESKLKTDPGGYHGVGLQYEGLEDYESAARCYEKSLELLPSVETTLRLALVHRMTGNDAEWERVLLSYLKQPDSGLKHHQIHHCFVAGYAEEGMWEKALPHARAAGQTWSSSGLFVAGRVTEALALWDESEKWNREQSESYTSARGYDWYFWCRRTGRGDVDAASAMARAYFENENYPITRGSEILRGIYRRLDERVEDALASYKAALAFTPSFTCTYMVAQVAREFGDSDSANQAIEAMEKHYAELGEKRSAIDDVGHEILQVIKSNSVTDEQLQQIDLHLQGIESNSRTAFTYFFAKQLEAMGNSEKADEYYRKALVTNGPHLDYATLAGARLAEKYNTSRKVDDVLDESDLWPQPAERKRDKKSEDDKKSE